MADKETLGEFGEKLSESISLNMETIKKAVDELRNLSLSLSNTFGSTRTRFVEINQAVADSLPRITRLGGSSQDVLNTIGEVAAATRKNVLASSEDVEKLFSVGKLIGRSVDDIVGKFTDVGVNFTKVGKQLETSINYVNSVGLNMESVMQNVVNNSDQLNRFNFEGGVQGLTKMAAQASMLRVDMRQTLSFAEGVLDPEKAIEVASGFQRLGVSVGNLVDPFQLMNASINDPQGLQNGLAQAVKQFSYFDEASKTFKINPGAIMKLKELSTVTGINVEELRKMSLAAREVDEIYSQIDPTIDIPEEDRMYLANIAKMGEGGEYEVSMGGEQRKLSELTNDEIKKLVKEQKEGPKTTEDLLRNQLTVSEILNADVKSIRDAVIYGPASQRKILEEEEGLYRTITGVLGSMSDKFADSNISRDVLTKYMKESGGFIDQLNKGVSFTEAMSNLGDKLGIVNNETKELLAEKMREAVSQAGEKLTDKTISERLVKKYGIEPTQKMIGEPESKTRSSYSKSDVNLKGDYTFNIKADDAVTQQQLTSLVNSSQFKQDIVKIIEKHFEEKGRTSKGY